MREGADGTSRKHARCCLRFLLSAARASYAHLEMGERLRGVKVADLMARDCPQIDGRSNLQTFVDDYLLPSGHRCYLVVANGTPEGLVTLREVKAVERARWPNTTIYDAMVPIERLKTVKPEMSVKEALEILGRADINQLPVLSGGRLEGIISRDRILRFLVTRAELEI